MLFTEYDSIALLAHKSCRLYEFLIRMFMTRTIVRLLENAQIGLRLGV
jgi:hypothetical protein